MPTDETLPFKAELSVLVEDSAYSGRSHLGSIAIHPNLVSVIRFPGNRVVSRKFELPEGADNAVGHPTWYGVRLRPLGHAKLLLLPVVSTLISGAKLSNLYWHRGSVAN